MNGAIRFAHQLNLVHFIFASARSRRLTRDNSTYNYQLEEEMKDLTEDKKDLFICFQKRFAILLIGHIFFSSPIFVLTIILPLLFFFFFRNLVSWLIQKLKAPLEEMESVAYAAGHD
jgi:hypothetical protein